DYDHHDDPLRQSGADANHDPVPVGCPAGYHDNPARKTGNETAVRRDPALRHSRRRSGAALSAAEQRPSCWWCRGAQPSGLGLACGLYRLRAATEVIGRMGGLAPREPRKGLVEKSKMPPSAATMR